MAEDSKGGSPNPPGNPPPVSSDDVSFGGGKYKTPDALEQGFNELRGSMGLDKIDGPLVGDKGLFRDHVALDKAYLDLQKIQSRGKPAGDAKPKPSDAKPGDKPGELSIDADDSDIDVDNILERSGLKFDALEEQWTKSGKLTDEQYAAIRKVNPGLSKKMIDHIAKGMVLEAQATASAQIALHEKLATKLNVTRAELQQTLITMGASVPAAERKALNEALNDSRFAELAVEKIVAYHRAATGSDGSKPTITGDGGGGTPAGIRSYGDLRKTVREAEEGNNAARRALGKLSVDQILEHGRF